MFRKIVGAKKDPFFTKLEKKNDKVIGDALRRMKEVNNNTF